MNKITEIMGAWIVSFNPTKDQKELAEKRYEICLNCEEYGEKRPIFGDEYCKNCSCPIQKKVYTQKKNETCPLKKWDLIEKQFREDKLKNNKYNII
jgi:hypothetical protein